MNTNEGKWYRSLAVILLATAGIVTTIATGGGGGGGSVAMRADPTLLITAENGEAVSTTVLAGAVAMFEISEATQGPLLSPSASVTPNAHRIGDLAHTYAELQIEGLVQNCIISGTVTLSGDVAQSNTLTAGDSVTAVFDNCDDNDGFLIDGELSLDVVSVSGDFGSELYRLTLDMVLTDLVVTGGSETVSGDGDVTLTIDSLDFPVLVTALSGSELTVGTGNEDITFRNFDQVFEVDLGVVPEPVSAEVNGRIQSTVLGGSVDYQTVVTIRASGDDDPYSGEILIKGADSSQVRIVIVSNQAVRLEIDLEGDGVVDEYIDTTWPVLTNEQPS